MKKLIISLLCLFVTSNIIAQKSNYEERVKNTTFDMVYVEGGSYNFGKSQDQKVTVSSFYISMTEVTRELWCTVFPQEIEYGEEPAFADYDDVKDFIEELNKLTGKHYRLPTEAEWEYAARGGIKSKGYIYSGSNNIGDVAVYGIRDSWGHKKSGFQVMRVASKQPNELGLYDMSGNYWEYCSDIYIDKPYLNGGYDRENTGTGKGREFHVIKGGDCETDNCYVYSRQSASSTGLAGLQPVAAGFRLVCDDEETYQMKKNYKEAAKLYNNKSYTEAYKLFLKSAEAGYPPAQEYLASCYLNGLGVDKNASEGFKWAKMSADKGLHWGQYLTAFCYYSGTGVEQNRAEAFKYMLLSAKQGSGKSMQWVGQFYLEGDGVSPNYSEGIKWVKEASKINRDACFYLSAILFTGKYDQPKDYKGAFDYALKAANTGMPEAQRNLAYLYEHGYGTEKDNDKAISYYTKAAKAGDKSAQEVLKQKNLSW
jgi:TPR repeat protein